MAAKKNWNAALSIAHADGAMAAAMAFNDPDVYPRQGKGLRTESWTGCTDDIMDALDAISSIVAAKAVHEGVSLVLVLTDAGIPGGGYSYRLEGTSIEVAAIGEGYADGLSNADPRYIRKAAADSVALGAVADISPRFIPGQYALYKNGDSYSLGRIKAIAPDGSFFVWYTSGDTASKTPAGCLLPLSNTYVIRSADLGGDDAKAMFPDFARDGKEN